eukprot:7383176-Prymnesium_polylepis.1
MSKRILLLWGAVHFERENHRKVRGDKCTIRDRVGHLTEVLGCAECVPMGHERTVYSGSVPAVLFARGSKHRSLAARAKGWNPSGDTISTCRRARSRWRRSVHSERQTSWVRAPPQLQASALLRPVNWSPTQSVRRGVQTPVNRLARAKDRGSSPSGDTAVMATRTPAVRERCRQLVAVLQASRCKHMVVRAEELQGELQLTQLDIVSVRPAPSVGASKVLPSCTQLGICLGFFIGAELCGQWGRQRAARAATQRVSRKLLGFDEQKPPGRVHAPVDRMTIKGARELW